MVANAWINPKPEPDIRCTKKSEALLAPRKSVAGVIAYMSLMNPSISVNCQILRSAI